MTSLLFVAGIVITLAFDELGALQRRSANGTYRKRDRTTGLMLLVVALVLVGVSLL